jgi:phosphoribosylglycinamide formyltransferase 1
MGVMGRGGDGGEGTAGSPSHPPAPARGLRLGILLSGGGRTLENLVEAIGTGRLPAEIVLVVSSHPEAFGLERARRHGLPRETVDWKTAGEGFSDRIAALLDAAGADLVVMAGFIRRWRFPDRYRGRVLNIHPALLPAFGGQGFYGDRVHEAVLASGARTSGCTVHFADDEYDRGPIILQRVVPVLPGDTPHSLADRVFAEECRAYPEAIRLYAEGRLGIRDGKVIVGEPAAPPGS